MGCRTIPSTLWIGLLVGYGFGCSSTVVGTGTGGSGSSVPGSDGGVSTTPGASDGGISTTPGPSGRVAFDGNQFCSRLVTECQDTSVTVADCQTVFQALLVTQACASGLPNASCADLENDQSAITLECFPKCSTPGVITCNGDGTVTKCTDQGAKSVVDCARLCQAVAKAQWSGVCGKTYQTQTSDNDKCWCE
jgi:hypothetical protein